MSAPYPTQNPPYPPSNAPYPPQATPYPQQTAPYPPQTAPYPPQATPYQPQSSPYGMYPPQPNQQSDIPNVPPPAYPATMDSSREATTNPGNPTNPVNQNPEDDVHFVASSFSDKKIRLAFIRKVYLILMAQLSVTLAFVCFFLFHEPTKKFVQTHRSISYVSYAVFFITYFVLVCCPSVRRKYPGNFICLGIFTLALSYLTATISSLYDTSIVMLALAITVAVCLAITIFAIQTKIDFTMCNGLMFILCIVLLLMGLTTGIYYAVAGYNHILNCVYGGLAALVFSLFLAYDTQQLIGGRKHQLSEEEYIYGALQLYLDVVNLFLIILSFFKSN